MTTSSERASYARPFWSAATRHGTPDATTTFHDLHSKRDFRLTYGRIDEFPRQDGARGLALGYLTKVRFVRFLSTPLATELTGIDLSKPGSTAEQASRLTTVATEFFELLVRFSISHPFRDGDYGNVSRSRALPLRSFCIFTGFSECLASSEMQKLRATWRARYATTPVPCAPPSPPPPPSPPSPPPPPPSPLRLTEDEVLEREMVAAFETAKAQSDSAEFSVSGCRVEAETSSYAIQRNKQRRGVNKGEVRVVVVVKGALRKRLRKRVVYSVGELRAAFCV